MDEPTDLTKPQRQRADALMIASRILGKRPGFTTGGGGIPEERTTEDLVDLAQFILRGEHPLEAYRQASLTPIVCGKHEGEVTLPNGVRLHTGVTLAEAMDKALTRQSPITRQDFQG